MFEINSSTGCMVGLCKDCAAVGCRNLTVGRVGDKDPISVFIMLAGAAGHVARLGRRKEDERVETEGETGG